MEFGRETGTALHPLLPILLVKAATEPRVKGREHRPCFLMREISKTVWLPHYSFHFFLSKIQTVAPASLEGPRSIATKPPTLRATEVLHTSFFLQSSCVLRTQPRQIQSQMINFERNCPSAIGVLLDTLRV